MRKACSLVSVECRICRTTVTRCKCGNNLHPRDHVFACSGCDGTIICSEHPKTGHLCNCTYPKKRRICAVCSQAIDHALFEEHESTNFHKKHITQFGQQSSQASEHESPLVKAIYEQDEKAVCSVLQKADTIINDLAKGTNLLLIACRLPNTKIFKLLLGHPKIQVNIEVLEYCCYQNLVEHVYLLLEYCYIDINCVGFCLTPLEAASERGHVDIVRLLLQVPSIDVNLRCPLEAACESGDIATVSALLQHPNIDVNRGFHYHSPLAIAKYNGHSEVVELLLSHPDIRKNDMDIEESECVVTHSVDRAITIAYSAPSVPQQKVWTFRQRDQVKSPTDFVNAPTVPKNLSFHAATIKTGVPHHKPLAMKPGQDVRPLAHNVQERDNNPLHHNDMNNCIGKINNVYSTHSSGASAAAIRKLEGKPSQPQLSNAMTKSEDNKRMLSVSVNQPIPAYVSIKNNNYPAFLKTNDFQLLKGTPSSTEVAKFQLGVWTRTKRNSPWIVVNPSPSAFFKPRRIIVQLVEPLSVPCTISIFVMSYSSDESVKSTCFLSSTPSKSCVVSQQFPVFKENIPAGQCKTLEAFLHRSLAVDLEKLQVNNNNNETHLVGVEAFIEGKRFLIHKWTTKPVRSHKWESSNRGRDMNTKNATQLLISVHYGEPTNILPNTLPASLIFRPESFSPFRNPNNLNRISSAT